jgi:pimeloyl-ACP methyl ester carboxylesterase
MIYPHFHQGKPDAAVRSRLISNGNGLNMHVLEAGFETANRPCVLLLHGFPELAFSWRKVLPALAAAGFHAVAPDQRGYGRST